MKWWHYVLIIVGVLAIYLIFVLVVYLLMKRAKKKTFTLLDGMIEIEKKRFDVINKAMETFEAKNRFLPKTMTDTFSKIDEDFKKVPFDVSSVKGQLDFMVLYIRKYISEKNLIEDSSYLEIDKELESILYLDPSDKNSPYYAYNKAASHYNAYLGMTILGLFGIRSKNPLAPIL